MAADNCDKHADRLVMFENELQQVEQAVEGRLDWVAASLAQSN